MNYEWPELTPEQEIERDAKMRRAALWIAFAAFLVAAYMVTMLICEP